MSHSHEIWLPHELLHSSSLLKEGSKRHPEIAISSDLLHVQLHMMTMLHELQAEHAVFEVLLPCITTMQTILSRDQMHDMTVCISHHADMLSS